MKKFFAVVKREYVQRVRTKFFVVATILGPLVMAGFGVVPALMFGIKSGGPTPIIVDQTGKMYERSRRAPERSRTSYNLNQQSPRSRPASTMILRTRQTKQQPDAGQFCSRRSQTGAVRLRTYTRSGRR